MALDLRDALRAEMRVHPRLVQQSLLAEVDARSRIAAAMPPLVPFGDAEYAGAIWILDWDHRLPSRHALLRVYAYYGEAKRRELEEAYQARVEDIGAEDLFPEFDVPDFAGLPSDEAYEAETDLVGVPARLRLVSEWRRQIQPRHAPSTSCAHRRRSASCAGRGASARPGSETWSRPSGRPPAKAVTYAGPSTSGTS